MDFFEVIENRISIRAFQKKEVKEEKLSKILATINSSPSAGNLQAYEVFVVKDEKKRKALAQAAMEQEFVAEAPIILVFCGDTEKSARKYGRSGRELYGFQDATIAASYAQLAATALGLSTCWIGAIYPEKVREIINCATHLRPICLLP